MTASRSCRSSRHGSIIAVSKIDDDYFLDEIPDGLFKGIMRGILVDIIISVFNGRKVDDKTVSYAIL